MIDENKVFDFTENNMKSTDRKEITQIVTEFSVNLHKLLEISEKQMHIPSTTQKLSWKKWKSNSRTSKISEQGTSIYTVWPNKNSPCKF